MGLNVHSATSLVQDNPDKPTLFVVQGRYQNWIKPVIILEYLKIDWQVIVLSDPDSGTEWYGKIHPYKYLPALIDNVDGERTVLWDSSTILAYLAERYDPERALYGRNMKERLEVQNWLIFETASLG
jgi:glutathione S-transferase